MLEVCWKEAASNKAYLCFANASNIIKEDIIVFSNVLQLDSFHLPLQPPHLCQPQRFCCWVYDTLHLHSHNSIRSEHREGLALAINRRSAVNTWSAGTLWN